MILSWDVQYRKNDHISQKKVRKNPVPSKHWITSRKNHSFWPKCLRPSPRKKSIFVKNRKKLFDFLIVQPRIHDRVLFFKSSFILLSIEALIQIDPFLEKFLKRWTCHSFFPHKKDFVMPWILTCFFKQKQNKICEMKSDREFWVTKWAIFQPYLVNISLKYHGIELKVLP
jgi:hypothetical protein